MHLTREQVHIDGLANRFFRSNEISNAFNDLTRTLCVVFDRLNVLEQVLYFEKYFWSKIVIFLLIEPKLLALRKFFVSDLVYFYLSP